MPNSKTLLQTLLAAFCAILCTRLCVGGGGMIIGLRTACWMKHGAPLPYDSLVDYIEGPTQSGVYGRAFLSDYIVRKGDVIRAKFRLLKFNSAGTCLLGSYYSPPGVRMSMIHIVESGGLHPWIGITDGYTCNNIPIVADVDYDMEIAISNTQAVVTVGDKSQTITASRDFESDAHVAPCGIMARYNKQNSGAGLENYGVFRMYNMSVTRGGIAYRDWKPARIGTRAVLFEAVSGTILEPFNKYFNGSYSTNVLYCGPDRVSA